MQEIYKLPYAPYFVYLFEKDKSMLKNFTYILDKVEDEKKESVELFLKSIIEGKEEVNKLKKSEIQNYNFIKENLENIVLYLKCKCEVFYWFYQGLPQLTQFGIW
jgi:type IV secretory pathway VirB9-like protein